jgi:hypothetical protein
MARFSLRIDRTADRRCMMCRSDTTLSGNAMQTTTARAIHAYWSRVKEGRDIPDRRDIKPAELSQQLPDLFILEQHPEAAPSFRLAGTRLCTLFGRELRGARFDRLFAPERGGRMSRICATVMSRRMPVVLDARAYGGSLQAVAVEILLLPMTSHSMHADRIFGSLCTTRPVQPLDLPFRYLTLEAAVPLGTERQEAPLQERPSAPLPATVMRVGRPNLGQTMRRVLHLRVFDGGR